MKSHVLSHHSLSYSWYFKGCQNHDLYLILLRISRFSYPEATKLLSWNLVGKDKVYFQACYHRIFTASFFSQLWQKEAKEVSLWAPSLKVLVAELREVYSLFFWHYKQRVRNAGLPLTLFLSSRTAAHRMLLSGSIFPPHSTDTDSPSQ